MTPEKSDKSSDNMLDRSLSSKGSKKSVGKNKKLAAKDKAKYKYGYPPDDKKKPKKEPKKEKKVLPLDEQTEKTLKKNGMLDAYQYVLMNICKNGLPVGDVFEYSAALMLNYEKKWKKMQADKVREKIMRYKEDKQKSLGTYGIDVNERSLNMSLDYTMRSKTPKKKDYEYYHNRSRSAKKSNRSDSSRNSPPEYQVHYNLNSLKKSIEYTKEHARLENNMKPKNGKTKQNDERHKTLDSNNNSILKNANISDEENEKTHKEDHKKVEDTKKDGKKEDHKKDMKKPEENKKTDAKKVEDHKKPEGKKPEEHKKVEIQKKEEHKTATKKK